MSVKETIDKAYGNIPKEPGLRFDLEFIPARSIRYYWLRIIRFIQNR